MRDSVLYEGQPKFSRDLDTTTLYENRSMTEAPEVYSYEFLTALPDMIAVTLTEVPAIRDASGSVDKRAVIREGMKNARSVGEERAGKVYVKNRYTGRSLLVTPGAVRHGLNGDLRRMLTNARLGASIGDLVQNAVPINAMHNKTEGLTGTYAMAGYATDTRGREFVAIITVEQQGGSISGIEVYDVTHAVSGRQKKASPADTKSQGVSPSTAGMITITDFLDVVNSTHRSILSDDVLARLRAQRPEGGFYNDKVKFSRDLDAMERRQQYEYESLVAHDPITLVTVDDTVNYGKGAAARDAVVDMALKNAKAIGKTTTDGKVLVYVDALDNDVVLAKSGLRHAWTEG